MGRGYMNETGIKKSSRPWCRGRACSLHGGNPKGALEERTSEKCRLVPADPEMHLSSLRVNPGRWGVSWGQPSWGWWWGHGADRRCFPGKRRQHAELKGLQLANSFTSKNKTKLSSDLRMEESVLTPAMGV